jgi:hypothetical protein
MSCTFVHNNPTELANALAFAYISSHSPVVKLHSTYDRINDDSTYLPHLLREVRELTRENKELKYTLEYVVNEIAVLRNEVDQLKNALTAGRSENNIGQPMPSLAEGPPAPSVEQHSMSLAEGQQPSEIAPPIVQSLPDQQPGTLTLSNTQDNENGVPAEGNSLLKFEENQNGASADGTSEWVGDEFSEFIKKALDSANEYLKTISYNKGTTEEQLAFIQELRKFPGVAPDYRHQAYLLQMMFKNLCKKPNGDNTYTKFRTFLEKQDLRSLPQLIEHYCSGKGGDKALMNLILHSHSDTSEFDKPVEYRLWVFEEWASNSDYKDLLYIRLKDFHRGLDVKHEKIDGKTRIDRGKTMHLYHITVSPPQKKEGRLWDHWRIFCTVTYPQMMLSFFVKGEHTARIHHNNGFFGGIKIADNYVISFSIWRNPEQIPNQLLFALAALILPHQFPDGQTFKLVNDSFLMDHESVLLFLNRQGIHRHVDDTATFKQALIEMYGIIEKDHSFAVLLSSHPFLMPGNKPLVKYDANPNPAAAENSPSPKPSKQPSGKVKANGIGKGTGGKLVPLTEEERKSRELEKSMRDAKGAEETLAHESAPSRAELVSRGMKVDLNMASRLVGKPPIDDRKPKKTLSRNTYQFWRLNGVKWVDQPDEESDEESDEETPEQVAPLSVDPVEETPENVVSTQVDPVEETPEQVSSPQVAPKEETSYNGKQYSECELLYNSLLTLFRSKKVHIDFCNSREYKKYFNNSGPDHLASKFTGMFTELSMEDWYTLLYDEDYRRRRTIEGFAGLRKLIYSPPSAGDTAGSPPV